MVFKALILMTILIGLLGTVYKRNLMLKILAMDVMSTGIVSLFVLKGAAGGLRSPILGANAEGPFADPVPQAVILTAIVIGFSVLALLLVCAMALSKRFPTLDGREIERADGK
jgi:multicomponent Na+:H+ antiporter subunit C